MLSAEQITALMPHNGEIQLRQTRFRTRLVDAWQIPEGAKVLEIGCGQGDTTAVLATAVGPNGFVTAIDIAPADYGSPVSIGDSMRHLKSGPLGDRLDVRLNFDAFESANRFEHDQFDVVVLAHCSWYFESLRAFGEVLRRVRPWAPTLCLSEWDMEPRSLPEVGHLLAVLIQGQIESYKTCSLSNIRTPYSREAIGPILSAAGWEVCSNALVDSGGLDDARWEINACLENFTKDVDSVELPRKVRDLLDSEIDVLRLISANGEVRSLCSYALVAKRTQS